MNLKYLVLTPLLLSLALTSFTRFARAGANQDENEEARMCNFLLEVPPHSLGLYQKRLPFVMPGLQVASLQDASESTGATLFYFPHGAYASFDARGGSVASSETGLLTSGSYSNQIDALVFAGGSTMGLNVAGGVRERIFRERAGGAGAFDAIPSVPTAVVYDFDGRIAAHHDPLAYPSNDLGMKLMDNLGSDFTLGRAGAGVNTSVNKINLAGAPTVWGGQGAAFKQYPWGKVFVAVILNALGDVRENGRSIPGQMMEAFQAMQVGVKPKHNTTLSLVVTDVPLDRNRLQRLSIQVHTSMGESIFPFHSYHDGDINFVASLNESAEPISETVEMNLAIAASQLMKEAILNSVKTANRIDWNRP